jgi:predicted CXXCH cytochrome family protein
MLFHPTRVQSSRTPTRTILITLFILFMISALFADQARASESASSAIQPEGHIATNLPCIDCHRDPGNDDFEFVHKEAAPDICIKCHDGVRQGGAAVVQQGRGADAV